MSNEREIQIEKDFVVIQGTKYDLSRNLSWALKEERKRVEAKQKADAEQLSREIELLTKIPVVGMTGCMTVTAHMTKEGAYANLNVDAHQSIKNNINLMLEHQARCLALITQKWCAMNREAMEKIYGKLDADDRTEQGKENLQQAA